jgi:DNA-binding NtrC family response regulator
MTSARSRLLRREFRTHQLRVDTFAPGNFRATENLSELLAGSAGYTNPVLHLAVLNELKSRSFPGNVRELRQVMARAAANYPGVGPLGLADLDAQDLEMPGEGTGGHRSSVGHDETLADFLRRALLDEGQGVEQVVSDLRDAAYELALAHASGNTGLAAELLKRSQRDVQKHIKARRSSEPTPE